MKQHQRELASDSFDWLPTAIEVLAMYKPGGEFADSQLPTDEAGRKAISVFHKGEFITIHLDAHPDCLLSDAKNTSTQ